VLNTQAKEDNVKEMIERLESEFEKEGAKVEQVQKMDKRHFSYDAGPLDAGYYVNFILNADPRLIVRLRTKFKLDPDVYRQLPAARGEQEKAPKSGKIEMISL
jgi:ribosomal protein S6